MSVILATQEAEIRRISVQNQPRQRVLDTVSKNLHINRAGGVAQGEGPEFKPQYHQKKKVYKEIHIWSLRLGGGGGAVPCEDSSHDVILRHDLDGVKIEFATL
jgi:hypothetical protein